MGRTRRSDPGCGVRECLDHRAVDVVGVGRSVVGGTRPPKAALLDKTAPVTTESTSELLRQLPYALGGYKVPLSADQVPDARGRGPLGRAQADDYIHLAKTTAPDSRRLLQGVRGQSVGVHGRRPVREMVDPGQAGGRPRFELNAPWLPEPNQTAGEATQLLVRRMRGESGSAMGHADVPRSAGSSRDGSVTKVAFLSKAVEPNPQFRPYMEDRYVSIDPFMPGEASGEHWAFYAVYDGHGGSQAAVHCESELHKVFSAELRANLRDGRGSPASDETIADAFVQTFQKVDDQLKAKGAYRHGTTATAALVRRSGPNVRVHTANVGDSRAVAVDDRSAWRLSQDHRPSDPSESRRIQQGGGFVSMGRVSGELAVSRALGDHHLKNAGLTCHPHVSVRDASHDDALVIASDGLWDTLSDADARGVVVACKTANRQDQTAQRLVEDAKRRGSMDNIACLVAFL